MFRSHPLFIFKKYNVQQHGKVVLKDGSNWDWPWESSDEFDRNMLPMTKVKFKLVTHAMNRNDEIFDLDFVPEGVSNYSYHSGIDRMFTEEYGDDICMVTWMGTNSVEGDWNQNTNIRSENIGDGECDTTEGLWQAFSGSGNGDSAEFVPVLETFIEECAENGKQLVFNGHSQGAGAAAIANAIYTDYKPVTILFGNAPWIFNWYYGREHCAPRPTEIWRFINSENVAEPSPDDESATINVIKYDSVPNVMGYPIPIYSAGGYIVLPPGDPDGTMVPMTRTVAYYGPESPEMDIAYVNVDNAADDGCGSTGTAHQLPAYRMKINDLNDQIPEGGVLDVSGFVDGSLCHASDQCHGACVLESDTSQDMRCNAKLEADEPCNVDADCASDECGGWNPFDRRCLD